MSLTEAIMPSLRDKHLAAEALEALEVKKVVPAKTGKKLESKKLGKKK